jgi:hypothetical protein
MGTRADFYVGRGRDAEWLGSITWDGYPGGIDDAVLEAPSEAIFREKLVEFLKREDATLPEQGWPWPWDDSKTTDYAYAFDEGKVWVSCFGRTLETLDDHYKRCKEESRRDLPKDAVFPNMKERKNVTMGKRSGLIIVGT